MDRNKNWREYARSIAVDLILGYELPGYDKLAQERFFSENKPRSREEIFYIHGLVSSLLVQAWLGRLDYGFDSPWPRQKLDLSEWQWKAFSEILEVFPRNVNELFYELDNSKPINQRDFLTVIQVALTHTLDHLQARIHG